MTLTPEQYADMKSVWERMEREHPEFIPWMDPLNNYHAVREIVLGGSVTWAGVHERFKPGPGKLVMDIGANAGIFSAFCAANGAKVVAYEPFLRPFAILKGMISACGLDAHITTLNKAVWRYSGGVRYFGNVSTLDNVCPAFNGSLLTDGIQWTDDDLKKALQVECVSFSDALGKEKWDCVKLDVEGAEFDIILATAPEVLRQIKFMYIEFHPWANDLFYDQTIQKLETLFKFEGAVMRDCGRWEAAYCSER